MIFYCENKEDLFYIRNKLIVIILIKIVKDYAFFKSNKVFFLLNKN